MYGLFYKQLSYLFTLPGHLRETLCDQVQSEVKEQKPSFTNPILLCIDYFYYLFSSNVFNHILINFYGTL